MIPNDEDEPLVPPLTPGFALLLAVGVGVLQVTLILMLSGAGFRGVGLVGMAAIPAYAAAFAVCAQRLPQPPSVGLALRWPRRVIWWAVFCLAWSLLLTSEIDNVVKTLLPVPDATQPASDPEVSAPFGPLFLVLVVVGPLTQELLFRGALQPAMVEHLGVGRGVAYTALLSSLAVSMAFSPWSLLPGFAGALLLGVLRHCSGSLYPSLALHALSGLATLAATYGLFGIGGFDDTGVAHTSLAWLIPAALFTGLGLRLCRRAAAAGPPPRPAPDLDPDPAEGE